ncbi:MAG TPA: hypothetical protein VK970_03090 [Candidatus Methylacidiphilales bacterium]|nr:hypothetical protein [Candidatus Methylacidiphilales bacterium]
MTQRFLKTALMPGLLAVIVSFVSCNSGKQEAPKADPAKTTISNAPSLAGTVVLDLPPVPAGDTRTLVGGNGMFTLNGEGDLVRGFTPVPTAGIEKVKIRQTKAADGKFEDSTYAIEVKAADWTIDAFPEMIIQSLTQQSVAQPGPVTQVPLAGVLEMAGQKPVAIAPVGSEPVKLADNGGIEFRANSSQRLCFKPESDALALYRWSLVIFRVDAAAGGTGNTATLVCVNDGAQPNGRSGYWIPRLEFDKTDNSVVAMYCGMKKNQLKSPANSVATNGKWNVALTYRRHGRLFLRVNGQDCGQTSPTESFSAARPEDKTESRIGNVKADAPGWALDGLWLGQSELSERVVEKMEAWALTRAATLPGGAAAAAGCKPVVDAEDFPHRYTFNHDRWAEWRAANTKEKRLAFQGQPVEKVQPDRSKWVRVFLDDFRKPAEVGAGSLNNTSIGDSTSDRDTGKQIWFAPGWNTAVGSKAICKDGNDRPFKDAYVLDPIAQTLTMRLYCLTPGKDGKPGKWASSQFTTVTDAGVGYSWAGPKGFRVRAKVGPDIAPGLFPCPLWFYGLEGLFWRTGERIEFDIIELDDDWDNYGGSHVHHGQYKGLFGHSAYDTMKRKTAPEAIHSLKLAAGKNVAGINAWDGKFHTWEVWIEEKLTYINCDGIEIARVDTTPEYLERLYAFVDTSLKEEKGANEAVSYDMVLDYIEGFAPPEAVSAVPGAPFTSRPKLQGTGEVGSTVTCEANITGVSDVWYYWHSGGYPRGFGRSKTYQILPDDKGAEIRCMVKAAGAKDQPESWTDPLKAQ